MVFENPMPPDLERQLYLEGIRLFNEGLFFEAHEQWEEIWHPATGRKRIFYQGLIQAAVALEHYCRSNPRGVLSLHHSYPPKLRQVLPRFMGMDVERFLREMEQALRPVVSSDPPPQRGEIHFDASTAPRIELEYDPFVGRTTEE